ncbi:hypothetical protein ACOZ4I_03960 [Haloarcula salina]|uniref:hypothetical protein n=1 Tax=Haloarcula salina TaxID=1429914 RepID=UPI003C704F8D
MELRSKLGMVIILFSYGGMAALVPPFWAPWTSPLNFFSLILVSIGLMIMTIIGGIIAFSGYPMNKHSGVSSYIYALLFVIFPMTPIYLYLVYSSTDPLAPMFMFVLLIGITSSLLTNFVLNDDI